MLARLFYLYKLVTTLSVCLSTREAQIVTIAHRDLYLARTDLLVKPHSIPKTRSRCPTLSGSKVIVETLWPIGYMGSSASC